MVWEESLPKPLQTLLGAGVISDIKIWLERMTRKLGFLIPGWRELYECIREGQGNGQGRSLISGQMQGEWQGSAFP